ncbi:hypothetical protein G7A79_12395 [Coprococcus sp. MSK.21.13]|nr:hypothetical protein [Coprococcus sp. MSK.21.13]
MRIRKLLPAFIMAAALTLTIPVSVYAAEDDNRDPQIREKGHRDNACQCDSHHIEARQELSAETGSHLQTALRKRHILPAIYLPDAKLQ